MLGAGRWPWAVNALCYFRQVKAQHACQDNNGVRVEDVVDDLRLTEDVKQPFRTVRSRHSPEVQNSF